jgi:hypothetical protein
MMNPVQSLRLGTSAGMDMLRLFIHSAPVSSAEENQVQYLRMHLFEPEKKFQIQDCSLLKHFFKIPSFQRQEFQGEENLKKEISTSTSISLDLLDSLRTSIQEEGIVEDSKVLLERIEKDGFSIHIDSVSCLVIIVSFLFILS